MQEKGLEIINYIKRMKFEENVLARKCSDIAINDGSSILLDGKEITITPGAFNQLLGLGAGQKSYQAWMFSELQDDWVKNEMTNIMNHVLEENDKAIHVHEFDGKIMGITSPRYVKIYDHDIYRIVEPISENVIVNVYDTVTIIEGEFSYFEDPDGNVYTSGIRVENNQYGMHSFKVNGFIRRLICSNGASIPIKETSYRKIHVGDVGTWIIGEISSRIKNDMVTFERMVLESYNKKVPENFLKRFRFTKSDEKKIKNYAMFEKMNSTYYTYANAISRLANDKNIEDRIRLQEIAGSIYNMAIA